MTLRIVCRLFLVVAAGITPTRAAVPETTGLDEFGKTAAAAMDSVGRFDEKVALDWVVEGGRKEPFLFPRGSLGEFEKVTCERSQLFGIIAHQNEAAKLNVGACAREASRIVKLAAESDAATRRLLDRMMPPAGGSAENRAKLERLLAYRETTLPQGMVGRTFALMIVGHGIIFIHTAVVHDPKRKIAFVAQGHTDTLCGRNLPPGTGIDPSPFCPDTGKALLDVAADLARRHVRLPRRTE